MLKGSKSLVCLHSVFLCGGIKSAVDPCLLRDGSRQEPLFYTAGLSVVNPTCWSVWECLRGVMAL